MKTAYPMYNTLANMRTNIENTPALQALAEEIQFNKFDLVRMCQQYDKAGNSAISPDLFTKVIQECCLSFNSEDIEELVNTAPKSKEGDILFRDLAFYIEVRD